MTNVSFCLYLSDSSTSPIQFSFISALNRLCIKWTFFYFRIMIISLHSLALTVSVCRFYCPQTSSFYYYFYKYFAIVKIMRFEEGKGKICKSNHHLSMLEIHQRQFVICHCRSSVSYTQFIQFCHNFIVIYWCDW